MYFDIYICIYMGDKFTHPSTDPLQNLYTPLEKFRIVRLRKGTFGLRLQSETLDEGFRKLR